MVYGDEQVDQEVIVDSGVRVYSDRVYLVMVDVEGRDHSTFIALDEVGDNEVCSAIGCTTWSEFMEVPDGDFGCGA